MYVRLLFTIFLRWFGGLMHLNDNAKPAPSPTIVLVSLGSPPRRNFVVLQLLGERSLHLDLFHGISWRAEADVRRVLGYDPSFGHSETAMSQAT